MIRWYNFLVCLQNNHSSACCLFVVCLFLVSLLLGLVIPVVVFSPSINFLGIDMSLWLLIAQNWWPVSLKKSLSMYTLGHYCILLYTLDHFCTLLPTFVYWFTYLLYVVLCSTGVHSCKRWSFGGMGMQYETHRDARVH